MADSQLIIEDDIATEDATPEEAVPALPAKRPFRIDEQLHIFFARTIYPELLRRTVPLNDTRVYTYPVEDPRMFKCLYTAFSKGQKPWKSVVEGSDCRFYPEYDKVADGYIIRVRMKDAQDQTIINWLYQYHDTLDRESKHCKLFIQFVSEYGELPYQELQTNVKRLLDLVDGLYPLPEITT